MIAQIKQEDMQDHLEEINILIVDDDIDILDALRDVLELEEDCYVIKTASSINEATKLLENFYPDIALIDIKIGNDNGIEFIPVIKQQYQDTVCMIMTAFRESDYVVSALKQGADDYLYKPIQVPQFLNSLKLHGRKLSLQRQQKQTEQRLSAVFNQSYDLMLVLDMEGLVLDCNHSTVDILGLSKADIIHKNLSTIPQFKNSLTFNKIFHQALAACAMKESHYGEFSVGELHFNFRMQPLLNESHNPEQIITVLHNITDIIQARKALIESNQDLEKKVYERTLEIEQSLILVKKENEERKRLESHLIKAKEEAENANQAKSKFLSRMSHELRTPMNAILGFGQLLELDEEISETQKNYIDEILKAGTHLLDLINEVLDIAQIEAGKYEIKPEPINLSTLMRDSISLIKPLASTHRIEIEYFEPITELSITGDKKRIKQILLNLLSNAVKYNKADGHIRVSLHEISDSTIRVDVKDTGIGIDEEYFDRIFIPFDRLDKDFQTEGSGIGLAVAKRLVEVMGGKMGFSSTAGVGTTFWFTMPRQ